ncbi:MAG: single-stranded DNA-binding protein [Chitinophagaceae bacterium]|nr:MAG: single-stranded DNA-binding protein [Chitinophagaceae bacterium]
MYAIKNNVQLIGRLMERPEVKEARDGKKTARFSILVEDSYCNGKGLYTKEVQRHGLVAHGKIAALAEKYLDKGTVVAIGGRLVNRHFDDSRGERRFVTEILVNELLILDMHMQEQEEYYE